MADFLSSLVYRSMVQTPNGVRPRTHEVRLSLTLSGERQLPEVNYYLFNLLSKYMLKKETSYTKRFRTLTQ